MGNVIDKVKHKFIGGSHDGYRLAFERRLNSIMLPDPYQLYCWDHNGPDQEGCFNMIPYVEENVPVG